MNGSFPFPKDPPNRKPDVMDFIRVHAWIYVVEGAAVGKRLLGRLPYKLAVSYETVHLKPQLLFVTHQERPSRSSLTEDGEGRWLSRSHPARTTKDNAL